MPQTFSAQREGSHIRAKSILLICDVPVTSLHPSGVTIVSGRRPATFSPLVDGWFTEGFDTRDLKGASSKETADPIFEDLQ
jgi:hypothetical protein